MATTTTISATEFPPVTYSSSFVSYLFQAASGEKDIVDEKDNDVNNTNNSSVKVAKKSSQTSPAKLRWKQLAKSAFVRNLQKSVSQPPLKHVDSAHTNGVSRDNSIEEDCLENKELSLLELLALKSLELSAPASDIILKNRTNNWVQLSGHEDSFALAGPGTIWKRRSNDETEVRAYKALMNDTMCDMVPKFYRDVLYKGENFIELQDLSYEYKDAAIMDIKMGSRTFLESEVSNTKARVDLYDKMVKIDENAPTKSEHEMKAVTKLTYMKFRENLSSSSNLGFRIEGFKAGNDFQLTQDLKLVKTREQVKATLKVFLQGKSEVRLKLIERLKELMSKFENSSFFKNHEVIGSSLLIIHNKNNAGVWMIDFAKTVPTPDGINIDHKSNWSLGNHEDGYLFGLQNLIQILEEF